MNKNNYDVVAEAVRMEHSPEDDKLYIVFEIVDERFKKQIRENWSKDVELIISGTKLLEKNER